MLYDFDRAMGYGLVAGIDEAGRGPLFGPVCVAIAIMPKNSYIDGVNDSKKLSEAKREDLYEKIIDSAIEYHAVMIDNETIDRINILNATKQGMCECIDSMHTRPDIILIDAVKIDRPNTHSIIKGDATSYAIACASIIAKVTRDRYIRSIADEYEGYNLAQNKGYGTKDHILAVKKYGPSKMHRMSFLKNILGEK